MILVGDWCPLDKLGEIKVRDGVILANLEAPILPSNHSFRPLPKAGPNLFSCNLPSREEPIIFSLANNHIMDYGEVGLQATIAELNAKGYYGLGSGKNIHEARKPIIFKERGKKIGVISCCEAQFGIAQETKAGVAAKGAWIYETVHSLKQKTDFIILSIHQGVEDSPWPFPSLQEEYRSYIDAGVSVIHGHHAHIPQGIETYGNGLILYGLGNFLVSPENWQDYPNCLWSIGIDVNWDCFPEQWEIMFFEIEQKSQNEVIVRESDEEERNSHRNYVENTSLPFKDKLLMIGLWQEVAIRTYFQYKAGYLNQPTPTITELTFQEKIKRIKLKLKKLGHKLFLRGDKSLASQYEYLLWYHMFSCDSHKESISTALGILSGEIEDLRTEKTCRLANEMMLYSSIRS